METNSNILQPLIVHREGVMIGNSFPEYLFIRTSITALRLVAPTSILYLALSVWNAAFPISPLLGAVAVAEAGFFLAFYLPRTRRLQAVCVALISSFLKYITFFKASGKSSTCIDEIPTSTFFREMFIRLGTHPAPVQIPIPGWMVFTSRSGISTGRRH